MQPSYGARLAPVPAREDHHVSTSLFDEPSERVIGRRHDGTPARRVRGTAVEALNQGEGGTQLRAPVRVDENLLRRARPRPPQGQGGGGEAPGGGKQRGAGRVP